MTATDDRSLLSDEYQLYVGGEWREGAGQTWLDAVNPYDQTTWARVAVAGKQDVSDAVGAAAEAFRTTWRGTSGLRRAELMHKLADLLDEQADHMALIETTDNGKVIRETGNQMHFAARNYRFAAGVADKLTGETKPLDRWDVFDYTTREPIGVAALITAWNSPMGLLANKLAPALAAGCCVVIKPSEHTSVSTLEFARLAEAAGFPAGVINVVTGAAETGSALTSDPRLGKISFTGSIPTGSRIAAAAAVNVIPVTLELGGKSANMIFADADLARAIPGAVAGIFAAAGQTCIAGSRLLVHRSLYDQVVEAIASRARVVKLGDPREAETEMGPVAHKAQWEKILGDITRARESGAQVVAGGGAAQVNEAGLFVEPTVLAEVHNDMPIAQQEVFGPVLAVIPFDEEDEAVSIANDTEFGLAAGIWTENLTRAHRVAKQLDCGTVWVNTYRSSAAQAPFGGVKHSGYGRERGVEAVDEYLRVKNTMIELSTAPRDPFTLRT